MFRKPSSRPGLNPYLFEMANIRDQDSWVHMHEPEKALEKAKDLIRGVVARVAQPGAPAQEAFPVIKNALVIGGGVAGMEAAMSIANMGFPVYPRGAGRQVGRQCLEPGGQPRGYDYRGYLEGLIDKLTKHPNIEVLFNSRDQGNQRLCRQLQSTIKTPDGRAKVDHGVTVMATGGQAYSPRSTSTAGTPIFYLPWSLTRPWSPQGPEDRRRQPGGLHPVRRFGEPQRPYCSRLCCTHSVESAIELKRPGTGPGRLCPLSGSAHLRGQGAPLQRGPGTRGDLHPLRPGVQARWSRKATA